jgi:holo-[acyl-carrier protein] synthase
MLRCGIDLVKISRMEAISAAIFARFTQRFYTEAEQAQSKGNMEQLAGLFAAKEAASKALGTGIGKVAWRDIEILHKLSGEPTLHLHGNAKLVASQLGLEEWAVSISHENGMAIACVVASGGKSSGS